MIREIVSTLVALMLLMLMTSCTGSGGQPGVAPECRDASGRSYSPCRVFSGRLKLPSAAELRLESKPFQVAAVGFEATGGAAPAPASDAGGGDGGGSAAAPTDQVEPRLFFGQVFAHEAGGGQRPDVPFSVTVPCPLSVNLLLQVPRSSDGNVPGMLVAAMTFERGDETGTTTTLVPRQPDDLCVNNPYPQGFGNRLDLGQVVLVLKGTSLSSGQINLGGGSTGCGAQSVNPLALLDTDEDGETDLADTDDDDDGEPDHADQDVDGDGILDSAQLLSSLPDEDGDGRPDLFR